MHYRIHGFHIRLTAVTFVGLFYMWKRPTKETHICGRNECIRHVACFHIRLTAVTFVGLFYMWKRPTKDKRDPHMWKKRVHTTCCWSHVYAYMYAYLHFVCTPAFRIIACMVVSLYKYMHTCICTHIYMHTCISNYCTNVRMHIYIYAYICIHVYAYICICIPAFRFIV